MKHVCIFKSEFLRKKYMPFHCVTKVAMILHRLIYFMNFIFTDFFIWIFVYFFYLIIVFLARLALSSSLTLIFICSVQLRFTIKNVIYRFIHLHQTVFWGSIFTSLLSSLCTPKLSADIGSSHLYVICILTKSSCFIVPLFLKIILNMGLYTLIFKLYSHDLKKRRKNKFI